MTALSRTRIRCTTGLCPLIERCVVAAKMIAKGSQHASVESCPGFVTSRFDSVITPAVLAVALGHFECCLDLLERQANPMLFGTKSL